MTKVTLITTTGALGFHRYFVLPDDSYFEFSATRGFEEGLIQLRGKDDFKSSCIVESEYSLFELKQRARKFGKEAYMLPTKNCRTFISRTLHDSPAIDWGLILGSVVIFTSVVSVYKTHRG